MSCVRKARSLVSTFSCKDTCQGGKASLALTTLHLALCLDATASCLKIAPIEVTKLSSMSSLDGDVPSVTSDDVEMTMGASHASSSTSQASAARRGESSPEMCHSVGGPVLQINADVAEVEIVHHNLERKKSFASQDDGEVCAHCSRGVVIAEMINFGCKSYPKWRCRPCHTAARALERSAKSKGTESYNRFCEVRRQQPWKFNDLVLAVRISPEGEAPPPEGEDDAIPKCMNLSQRKEKISKIICTTFSEKGSEDFQIARWLSERQFKAQMKVFEGMNAEESQLEWDRAVADKQVQRRFSKTGVLQIAVLMEQGVKTYGRRGNKREFANEEDASEEEDSGTNDASNAACFKRLRTHAFGEVGNFAQEDAANVISKAVVAPPVVKGSNNGAQSVQSLLATMSGAGAHAEKSKDDGSGGVLGAIALDSIPSKDNIKTMGLTKACSATPSCILFLQ